MTTLELYRKHKSGEVSREKFLYEVRRDNNLPWITNLTSYDDAVKILKNKGIVNEVETKEAKADEAVKAEVKAKAPSTKKPESLHIDHANPYEYRHGLQHELHELGEYTDEALEKAKETVLKNLAKDVNFYSNLLNQKQSPFEFKASETDAPGMQAKADGYLKKELKKDEKANVKDNLGKKEEGSKKPKGVEVMSDKGVTGSEKTIKEGLEEAFNLNTAFKASPASHSYNDVLDIFTSYEDEGILDDFKANFPEGKDISKIDYIKFAVLYIDDMSASSDIMANWISVTDPDVYEKAGLVEAKKKVINKYVTVEVEDDGDEYPMLNKKAIADYLKSVIDPSELKSVSNFMNDDEGFDESASYFFEDEYVDTTEKEVEDWAKQEMSYYLFSKPDEFPGKENIEEEFRPGVDLGKSFEKFKNSLNAEDEFEALVKKYDWYAEMSDDSRKWDAQQAMERKLSQLAKTIGVDKAVEIFNQYAPSDRKVTSDHSMWMKEDKHAKLKETLKTALKKEILDPKDVQAAKKTGTVVNIPVSDTAAQTQAKNAKINFRTYQ